MGKPNIDVEVKIAEDGEVMYQSPGMFVGYYKDPRGRQRPRRRTAG